MERLTERFSNGQAAVYGCGDNCKHDFKYCETYNEDCPTIIELYEKLAEYEDLEEQGALIRLPIAVGGTVYQCMIVEVDEKRKLIYKVFAAKVFKYSLDSYALCFWTETKDNFKYRNEMPLSAFGKFVFLTKEEAEAALERMSEK